MLSEGGMDFLANYIVCVPSVVMEVVLGYSWENGAEASCRRFLNPWLMQPRYHKGKNPFRASSLLLSSTDTW